MDSEPIKLLASLIQTKLGLSAGQVLLEDQKFQIPPDDRLYITLAVIGSKPFANRSEYGEDGNGNFIETSYVNTQEMWSITAESSSGLARSRAWEIIAALSSEAAEQLQEQYSFKLANIPGRMTKIPDIEGTSRLQKYNLTVNALVAYRKQSPVDYYDDFGQPKIYTNQ